jgi:hypothetical protein
MCTTKGHVFGAPSYTKGNGFVGPLECGHPAVSRWWDRERSCSLRQPTIAQSWTPVLREYHKTENARFFYQPGNGA